MSARQLTELNARKLGEAVCAIVLSAVFHWAMVQALFHDLREHRRSLFHMLETAHSIQPIIVFAPAVDTVKAEAGEATFANSASKRSDHRQTGDSDAKAARRASYAADDAISPLVDWYAESGSTIQSVFERQRAALSPRSFSAKDRKTSIPRPRSPQQDDFPWDPLQGRRVGLTPDGVFYVKISEKCMIVMLLIGCRFGGEIKYRDDLFLELDVKLDKIRERELRALDSRSEAGP